MSEVLNKLRSQVGAANLSNSCSRDGCQVDITDVPRSRVIIDVDKALSASTTTGKRCDYVLFFMDAENTLVTVPLELKSGGVDSISEVCEQLQQGATYAEDLAREDSEPICCPLLFHGKGIHKAQRPKLNRAKVRFRGRRLTIDTTRCGENLIRALKEK